MYILTILKNLILLINNTLTLRSLKEKIIIIGIYNLNGI